MKHRNPETYKQFIGMQNIIVGDGELVWNEEKQAWATPTGNYITDRAYAIEYATNLNKLIQKNSHLRKKKGGLFI
ncbi:hypothetical protein [Moraxella lincolnii]|uniref:hypothetical protein n=1 Tax=Lwoffella lincolnii TaxID=90241 RepID=UPI0039841DE7